MLSALTGPYRRPALNANLYQNFLLTNEETCAIISEQLWQGRLRYVANSPQEALGATFSGFPYLCKALVLPSLTALIRAYRRSGENPVLLNPLSNHYLKG